MAAMMMATGDSKSPARALRRLAGAAVAAVTLRRSFCTSKCKTEALMAMARMKLLRNRREAQVRRDIAALLRDKQEDTARIRFQSKRLQHRMVKPRTKTRIEEEHKKIKTAETGSGVLNWCDSRCHGLECRIDASQGAVYLLLLMILGVICQHRGYRRKLKIHFTKAMTSIIKG